jgi:hypothetical protein
VASTWPISDQLKWAEAFAPLQGDPVPVEDGFSRSAGTPGQSNRYAGPRGRRDRAALEHDLIGVDARHAAEAHDVSHATKLFNSLSLTKPP